MQKLTIWLLTFSLLAGFSALARENKDCQESANDLPTAKSQMSEVGRARLRVWFRNVYNSALYTPTGKYDAGQQCLLFEIDYLMDISKDTLIKSTVENWQHLKVPATTYQPYIKSLHNIWTDVSKGDQLALKVNAAKSSFYLNGKYIGSIRSNKFGSLFLSIWLSENTTQPMLRKQLIGAA